MYKELMEHFVHSLHVKDATSNIDMRDYENNKYFFDVQKMINNTGNIKIKNKELNFYVNDVKDFKDTCYIRFRDGRKFNSNQIINNVVLNVNTVEDLVDFFIAIPHKELYITDGILCITLYKSSYISDSLIIITFEKSIIYAGSDKKQQFYLNEDNPIFEFIESINSECERRNILLHEMNYSAYDLVRLMKSEQENMIKDKRNRHLDARIYNYLH